MKVHLSESSLDACRGYTGYDYKNINSGLISGLIFNSDAGYLKRLCNGIDEAIYKYGGLKEDSIFYREFHIDNSHVKKNSLYAKLIENIDCSDINQVYSMFSALIGKEISNPNYQSSSFIKGGAQLDANVMFEIKAPKGTAGVDISILSERTGILNEDEFLFARNTDLKIENVSLQEFNGQTIVYVECTAESNFEYNNINNSKLIIDSYIDFISNVLNELTESYKKNYEYAKQHDQYENSFDDFLNEYPPLNYFDYKNKLDLLIKIREMIYNELQK